MPSESSFFTRLSIHLRRILPMVIVDALILTTTYPFALWLRVVSWPITAERLLFLGFIVLVILISLYYARAYHRVWTQTSGYSVLSLVWAVMIPTFLIIPINYMTNPRMFPTSVILASSLLSLMGIVAVRYRSRITTEALLSSLRGNNPSGTRVLIVGAGESGETLAWRLQHRFRTGQSFQIIGFIDDNADKQGRYIEGLPVFGERHLIPTVVDEHHIDLIVVAIHNIDGADFRDILNYCEQTSALIKVVPDTLALLDNRTKAAPIRDVLPEDLMGRTTIERHSSVNLSTITHKRILVTGAAGSIGSELSRQLSTYEPECLVLLDNNESGLYDLYIDLHTKHPTLRIEYLLQSVSNPVEIKAVFERFKPQLVFHAAAYKHVPVLEIFPQQALYTNVLGTLNVAQQAYEHEVERFVFISTDKAVNPSNVMGASKRLCEYIVHAYSKLDGHRTRFTAVRFGNVLGSRGSILPLFNHQLDNGWPLTVTHPDVTRYFMSIAEAVNLVIHAAAMTQGDEIFLLRMGEHVRILDIAERMIRLRGLRPYQDIDIQFVGLRVGEKLHEELHTDFELPSETPHPHIFKLNGWDYEIEPTILLEKIRALTIEGLPEDDNPLEALLHVLKVSGKAEFTN